MSVQEPVLTPPNGGETVTSSGGSSFEMKVESSQSGGDYGAILWTVRAGKIWRGQGYLDPEEALAALGLEESARVR